MSAPKFAKLQSVRERLPLIEEEDSVDHADSDRPLGTSVFVVHGHDDGAREGVARFLEKLGLHTVILPGEANRGMTLIEKFEAHAQAAGYAVVLMTPDDIGRSAGATDAELTHRARQNVVFEAGFFYGALGRDRVAILYSQGIEQPSDIDGIAWIPLDQQTWKLELGKELRAAGFSVDMNRI